MISLNKLFKLGFSFLKNSRKLTFSAFFSVFIACFLGVGLFQLSANIERSVRTKIEKEYKELAEDYREYLDAAAYSEKMALIQMEKAEAMEPVRIFIMILYGVILCICSLFIISIFHEFLKKYMHEMAIIRTFGGQQKQVEQIFLSMSVTISFFACVSAGVMAVLTDGILFHILNQRFDFFEDAMRINWLSFFVMITATFLIINFVLYLFFIFGQQSLPIQIFHQTESSLNRKRDGLRFLWIRKVTGTEGFLAWKLLSSGQKQNMYIILLVLFMTIFSCVGESSLTVLIRNNDAYYRELLHGADGQGSLCLGNAIASQDMNVIFEKCRQERVGYTYFHGNFYVESVVSGDAESDTIWAFEITDMPEFQKYFMQNDDSAFASVPPGEQAVVGKELANDNGYQLGDKITIRSEYLKENRQYTIVGIVDMKRNGFLQKEYQLWIDKENFMEINEDECGCNAYFYFYGNSESIQRIVSFMNLKWKDEFKGYVTEPFWADMEKQVRQIVVLFNIAFWGLMLVIGVGWLNSASGMLLSGRRSYRVFRLLGMYRKRMQRICYIQVWSYLLPGILFGIIIGNAITDKFWNSNGMKLGMQWGSGVKILLLFIVLSVFLSGTVREVTE